MKFLLVTELFPNFPGGAENHVFRVLKELQRRGHEVGALCAATNQLVSSEEAGFPVFKVLEPNRIGHEWGEVHDGIRRYGKWVTLTPEQKILAEEIKDKMFDDVIDKFGKPDVVISHMYWSHMFFNQMKKLGVTMCNISHKGIVKDGFDYYLYNSEYSQQRKAWQKGLMTNPEKTSLDDHDLLLYPICKVNQIKTSGEFDFGQIKLLGHKGPEIFWQLAKDFPDKKFLVVRAEWATYDKMIDVIPTNVTVVNAVKDITNEFFSKIKVYLHPATQEDFGMAALEAQHLGIPVLYNNKGGLMESVGGGGVPCDDYSQFNNQVRLLDDDNYYHSIVLKGFEHAEQMYKKTMEQYDVWLKKLTAI